MFTASWPAGLSSPLVAAFGAAVLALTGRAMAADPPPAPFPQITFAAFPAPLRRTTVHAQPGVPAAEHADKNDPSAPGTPFSTDHPPVTVFRFETIPPAHSGGSLAIYSLSSARSNPYPTLQTIAEHLKKLLADRRTGNLDRLNILRYPIANAATILQAKTRYFDAAWGSGVFYLASYAQGYGEYPANGRIDYQFAGLSKDGDYYIAGVFHVEHPWLDSADYLRPLKGFTGTAQTCAAEQPVVDAITIRAQKILAGKPEGSFRPALGAFQRWLATLTIQDSRQDLWEF